MSVGALRPEQIVEYLIAQRRLSWTILPTPPASPPPATPAPLAPEPPRKLTLGEMWIRDWGRKPIF